MSKDIRKIRYFKNLLKKGGASRKKAHMWGLGDMPFPFSYLGFYSTGQNTPQLAERINNRDHRQRRAIVLIEYLKRICAQRGKIPSYPVSCCGDRNFKIFVIY